MKIFVRKDGRVQHIYDEKLDTSSIGKSHIMRASNVEPDNAGKWSADLKPVGGPQLQSFDFRSQALRSEIFWLVTHLRNAS